MDEEQQEQELYEHFRDFDYENISDEEEEKLINFIQTTSSDKHRLEVWAKLGGHSALLNRVHPHISAAMTAAALRTYADDNGKFIFECDK